VRLVERVELGDWTVDALAVRRAGQVRVDEGVLLRVEAPVMRLQGPGEDRLVAGRKAGRFSVVGLDEGGEARMVGRGWEIDGGYTLRPHLSCDYRPRDWAWAWTPTYGPVSLTVYLRRTQAELLEWLDGQAPHGYEPRGKAGELQSVAGLSHNEWLDVGDGFVRFMRGYQTPWEGRVWLDAGLLGSLLVRFPDAVSWDLLDGDYRAWMATGHSREALADYLRADGSTEREAFRAALRRETVEAGTLRDEEEIAAAIRVHFGLAAGVDLMDWLRETPLAEQARTVTVNLPRDLHGMYEKSPLMQGLVRANWRVFWSFSFGG
jgi:hypothetical protein